jgi:hypothetical protein
VARLPWLWRTGSNDDIARQVAEVFAHTSDLETLDWSSIEDRWLTLIRRGYALNRLKEAIAGENIAELAKRITQSEVRAGELLWQGHFGFCVAETECRREPRERCNVFLFQRGNSTRPFSGSLLIPVAGLLGVVDQQFLDVNARNEIDGMLRELEGLLLQPLYSNKRPL